MRRSSSRWISGPDQRIRGNPAATRVAIVFHHWELHAFRSFGLPWPSAAEIVAGIVETLGGLLLVMRRAVLAVTAALAVTMVVAIVSSGIEHGDVIPSLTLAPALLIAVGYVFFRAVRQPGSARRYGSAGAPAGTATVGRSGTTGDRGS